VGVAPLTPSVHHEPHVIHFMNERTNSRPGIGVQTTLTGKNNKRWPIWRARSQPAFVEPNSDINKELNHGARGKAPLDETILVIRYLTKGPAQLCHESCNNHSPFRRTDLPPFFRRYLF